MRLLRRLARPKAEALVESGGGRTAGSEPKEVEPLLRVVEQRRQQQPSKPPPPLGGSNVDVPDPPKPGRGRVGIPADAADRGERVAEEDAEQHFPLSIEAKQALPPFLGQPEEERTVASPALGQQRREERFVEGDPPDTGGQGRSSSARAKTSSNIAAVSRLVF